MIISSGGNVGIGVTGVDSFTNLSVEPLERLHVSGGNFRVDGNIYTSGQLWITGTDGLPRQISGEGGGGSIGDYITALGISGYNLSGQTLWVGHGGVHVSGNSPIPILGCPPPFVPTKKTLSPSSSPTVAPPVKFNWPCKVKSPFI